MSTHKAHSACVTRVGVGAGVRGLFSLHSFLLPGSTQHGSEGKACLEPLTSSRSREHLPRVFASLSLCMLARAGRGPGHGIPISMKFCRPTRMIWRREPCWLVFRFCSVFVVCCLVLFESCWLVCSLHSHRPARRARGHGLTARPVGWARHEDPELRAEVGEAVIVRT